MYQSTKTYGHEVGLSAVFRQWKAKSHCNMLHGYALSFRFVFEAMADHDSDGLDERGWVVDFGDLKDLKAGLVELFDHKCVVALDDPQLDYFKTMDGLGILDLLLMPAVGCEAFARTAFELAEQVLARGGYTPRVRVVSAECREHGANSAIYAG